jgi:hypothetical protein
VNQRDSIDNFELVMGKDRSNQKGKILKFQRIIANIYTFRLKVIEHLELSY